MWSRQAALDLRSASMLGVGHFTIPPDVVEPAPSANSDVTESWSTVRTIIVPHGITAVRRRSPITTRKRTAWHPSQEPHGVVERGGSREWFTDRLFVESKQANLPAACSTSAMVHAVVIVLVLLLLAARAARADLTPRKLMDVSLQMPSLELLLPVAITPPATRKVVERPLPATPPPAPMPARTIETPAAAPLETPSSIEVEPTTLDDAPLETAAAGAEVDGVTGGVTGGTGSALPIEPAQPSAAAGPFRVGEGIARPRKIKDVKPVYPVLAMSARVGGNVLIEATIGVDGKVHNARVLQSIASLDQAALDAVRQWEFEPSRINGEPVAVMMVIVVTFALL